MKQGRSLQDLAAEIQRQAASKRDYLVDTGKVEALVKDSGDIALAFGEWAFPITDYAHRQVNSRLKIPADYYDRMRAQEPALLATNINTWLHREPERRLVRTLDGKARAFLSDSYSLQRDNIDVAEACLPVLIDLGVEVMSSEITERRLYIKAIDQRIHADVPTGRAMGDGTHTIFETCCASMVISNSEVGAGSTAIEAGYFERGCTNLALFGERSMKRYHIGGKLGGTEDITELLSDATRRLTDSAVMAQMRDLVKAAFSQAQFDALAAKLKDKAANKITSPNIEEVVEVTAKKLGLAEGERVSVLNHLIRGADLSQWGLAAAITRASQDVADYDRATDLERFGGKIIEMAATDFRAIAEAAMKGKTRTKALAEAA